MPEIALRDKDLDTLRNTFRKFPAVREVRLFGSRAAGHARRASDIDLAIVVPDITPREWADLHEALDAAPIIYEIDLVRSEQVRNDRLRERIAAEGVTIYPEGGLGP
jgi:uncharacterized protein